ncbi:sigma factor-like helix-turn-helix DNA-binding protein [Streptomyces sp. NPDC004296]
MRLYIHEILSAVDNRSRAALIFAACGYTNSETAAILNATPKAVEMTIYRARLRIRPALERVFTLG